MPNYLPNIRLSNGILICGPMKKRPADEARHVELEIDGTTYYCVHSGDILDDQAMRELDTKATEWIAGRPEKYS